QGAQLLRLVRGPGREAEQDARRDAAAGAGQIHVALRIVDEYGDAPDRRRRVPGHRGLAHRAGDRVAELLDAVARAVVEVDGVAVVAGLGRIDEVVPAHDEVAGAAAAVAPRVVAVVACLGRCDHAVSADGAVVGATVVGDGVAIVALLALVGLERPVAAVRRRRNRRGGRGAGRRGRHGRLGRAGGGDGGSGRGRRWDGLALAPRALLVSCAARRTLAPLSEPRVQPAVATTRGGPRRERLGGDLLRLDAARERRAVGTERTGQLDRLDIPTLRPDDVDLGPGLGAFHLAVQGASLGGPARTDGDLLVLCDGERVDGHATQRDGRGAREAPGTGGRSLGLGDAGQAAGDAKRYRQDRDRTSKHASSDELDGRIERGRGPAVVRLAPDRACG